MISIQILPNRQNIILSKIKCTPLLTLSIYFQKSYYNVWGSTLPGMLYMETQIIQILSLFVAFQYTMEHNLPLFKVVREIQ